ncbi:MAG: glycosyltransferase family 2 protein [Planctomycetota bacterium]|jgi:glycosyltransferase involved in cell wall biosynthesis
MPRWLAAIPVYNEVASVRNVLDEVTKYAPNVLAIDDGSSDGTSELLDRREDVTVLHHPKNLGYGAALRTAFQYAIDERYEILVTLDCDGQHQPKRIPRFVAACKNADIVSGSRYLKTYEGDSAPPAERLFINRTITKRLNDTFGWNLTDTFCGFKAYRVSALEQLRITVDGYAMPLELWVQAAYLGLRIIEVPVPLIYLDLSRSFGGSLDDGGIRLQHYNSVIDKSVQEMLDRGYVLPTPATVCRGECC